MFKPKWIAILTSRKSTTETNAHIIFLQNKITADNYGRNTIKTPSKIPSKIPFCSSAKLLQLLNKFVVNMKDNHLNIECNAIENTLVN